MTDPTRIHKHANAPRPAWVKVRAPGAQAWQTTNDVLQAHGVATVCREAACPNQAECWAHKSATFLIAGEYCTRGCTFCGIKRMKTPPPPDPTEPMRLARAVADLGLEFVVITSVDRDDLVDLGAAHWRACLDAIATHTPSVRLEVLVPDFDGRLDCIEQIFAPNVAIFGHNLETVPRLYRQVRGGSQYLRSLDVLRLARQHGQGRVVKTSIMLGVGETDDEVVQVLRDAYEAGANAICIGQYLPPHPDRLGVERYVEPDQFAVWEQIARQIGFQFVAAGPFVRSSFRSWEWAANWNPNAVGA